MLTRPDRLLWISGLVFLALFAATLLVAAFDKRVLDGVPIWAKPLKFQLSLAVHLVTLGIIAAHLSPPVQASRLLAWTAAACLACSLFEIAYIMLQAARVQPSHFNVSSPLYATLYKLMAAGAVVITCTAAVVGVLALWDDGARLSRPVRHGVVLGLVAGSVLTLVAGFTIGSRMSHAVGEAAADAARMPLTGWSLSVGDLRIPHFLATHMMQSVPLAGVLAAMLLPPLAATAAVWIFAGGWTLATYYSYTWALAGGPLLR
ncbi:MAG: hypothetical protein NW223_16315 [Hyphomicrobiaceae bacterium]|nr:hypothetical protein [Hyphomicrobiaceae bacterium]